MAVSPLAMAEQSKKLGKDTILQALKEMGALDNKNITMGEVWKNVRHKFPAHIQAQLDMPFSIYKDEKIPQLDLTEVKNSSGETVVALNIKDGSDTARIEFPGKENQFMKFNGINLSLNDIANPRILTYKTKDEKIIKKDFERYEKELAKKPVFPAYEHWVKMTPYQRAKIIVQIRLLMREVEEVLSLAESQASGSSPNSYKDYSSILKLIFGLPAEAGKDGSPKGGKSKRKIAKGENCIIGGYPTGIVLGDGVCSLGPESSQDFKKYNMGCPKTSKGQSQIGCNPVLYGYDRSNHGPICFPYDKSSQITKFATSINGVCEEKSPLERGNFDQAFSMIKSIALHKGMTSEGFDQIFSIKTDPFTSTKKISVNDETEYLKLMTGENGIFTAFEKEKNKAVAVCKTIRARPDEFQLRETKQQTKACDAVEKRMLDVKYALELVRSTSDEKAPAETSPPCTEDDFKSGTDDSKSRSSIGTSPRDFNIVPVRVVATTVSKSCQENIFEVVTDKPGTGTGTIDRSEDAPTAVPTSDSNKTGGFWSGVKSFFGGPWGKVIGLGALLGIMVGGTVWGLSRFFKRKETTNIAPYVYSNGTDTTTTTPAAPTPIEGGTGTSSATGGGVQTRKAGK